MPKKNRFIILLMLVVVAVVAVVGYQFYKKKFLSSTLPETVQKESRGLYSISYDTIDIDEVSGSLYVSNLKVSADTASFETDSLPPGTPSSIINLHADSLLVSGIETPRALLRNEISGRKVHIKNVSIELFRLVKKEKAAKDEEKTSADLIESIYYDVLKELKMVNMDTILLENIDISYKDFKTKKLILRSANVSLLLYDLLIDSNSLEDKSRIFFSKKVVVVADSIHLRDPNSRYDFRFTGLEVNTAARRLRLKSATIKPLLGESAFMKLFKTQKDRFDFALADIDLTAIDPVRLAVGELSADSLTVGNSRFKIYRDVRMARDKENRVGQYPHQVIMKIPFPLNIKKSLFTNSFVEYKEINEKTDKAGLVQFHRVGATITNLTNERSAIAKNDVMTIDFDAWFLNMARVEVKMNLRIGDKQGRFTVKGNLQGFDAKQLNKLTEPLGMARVEEGKVNKISFDMSGDNYNGRGELIMLYDNLKVSALKLEDDKSGFKKKGLASAMANAIVKNKNPSGGKTRTADMANERNTNRSFFNLLWKSIFTGVKETVGMDIMGKRDQQAENDLRAREGTGKGSADKNKADKKNEK